MATEPDQISSLSEGVDTLSISAEGRSWPYKEANLGEKGVGCIASQDIRKGDLVLRESPQLLVPPEDDTNWEDSDCFRCNENIMKTFLRMGSEDQKMYMQLDNKYEEDHTKWSEQMKIDLIPIMRVSKDFTKLENISKGLTKQKAWEVWGRFTTNSFHNGVCLKMSRFNHSCRSNAQYFWNEDTNTRDIRALRKIKEGEEITVNYNTTLVEPRDERRRILKDKYNFDCNCEACDLTEEQIQCEKENIQDYNNERQKQREFKEMGMLIRELECLKQMYRLAKEIKTISHRVVLYNIVGRAYKVSCEGVENRDQARRREDWEKDAKQFADIGLKISKTLNGDNHSQTKVWRESLR